MYNRGSLPRRHSTYTQTLSNFPKVQQANTLSASPFLIFSFWVRKRANLYWFDAQFLFQLPLLAFSLRFHSRGRFHVRFLDRWLGIPQQEKAADYDTEILYKPGKKNVVVDALSWVQINMLCPLSTRSLRAQVIKSQELFTGKSCQGGEETRRANEKVYSWQ